MKPALILVLFAALLTAEAPIPAMKQQTLLVIAIFKNKEGRNVPAPMGSGFVIAENRAVTNFHVCCKDNQIIGMAVALNKESIFAAKVIWSSEEKDLAILETDKPMGRKPVDFALTKEGQTVWAIGFPGAASVGKTDERGVFEPTITRGVVSRYFTQDTRDVIQIDTSISGGNSGGPLFDECGRVVGINYAGSAKVQSINFAINQSELLPEISKLGPPVTALPVCSTEVLAPGDKGTPPWLLYLQIGGALAAVAALLLSLNQRVRKSVTTMVRGARHAKSPTPPPLPVPPPVAVKRLALRGISGTYAGQSIPLGDQPCILGRDPQLVQLVFPQDASHVSKRHCEVRLHNGAVSLEDLWSSNGTYLDNGEKIPGGSTRGLRPGQRFYLGNRENLFEVVES